MQEVTAYLFSQRLELMEIVKLSLAVSGTATLLGALTGIPAGSFIALNDFRGKSTLIKFIFTLMALPPVLAGLVVYLLLSRSGPLGHFEQLFTPVAMIAAQFLLVTPIITGLSAAAVANSERQVFEQARSLGASPTQAMLLVIRESRTAIISAVMTGFGRAFAEVGAVMLVGGNIRHMTRVLTTTIVMETRMGNFEMAVASGVILLIISFIISSIVFMNTDEFRAAA